MRLDVAFQSSRVEVIQHGVGGFLASVGMAGRSR